MLSGLTSMQWWVGKTVDSWLRRLRRRKNYRMFGSLMVLMFMLTCSLLTQLDSSTSNYFLCSCDSQLVSYCLFVKWFPLWRLLGCNLQCLFLSVNKELVVFTLRVTPLHENQPSSVVQCLIVHRYTWNFVTFSEHFANHETLAQHKCRHVPV